jgi:hypothetical protein
MNKNLEMCPYIIESDDKKMWILGYFIKRSEFLFDIDLDELLNYLADVLVDFYLFSGGRLGVLSQVVKETK